MKNKPLIKLSALAAIGLLVVVAFAGLPTIGETAIDNGAWDGYKWVEPLYAGQNILVGTVTAWLDADGYIHVEFDITDEDWEITDTHVAIVTGDCSQIDGSDFPTTKSLNPKVGQFPYTAEDFPIEASDVGYDEGDSICIAAHAVVQTWNGYEYESQTAWAGGHDFGGKSWAVYFCFMPRKVPKIPSSITFTPYFPGDDNLDMTYWDVKITAGGSGNAANGWYDSWCVDISGTLTSGTSYSAALSIPTGTAWNMVNWILNNIDDEDYAGIRNGSTCTGWEAIQAAIWKLVVPGYTYNTGVTGVSLNAQEKLDAAAIVWLASSHGDFWPSDGEYLAVLISFSIVNRQEIIIEVDP